jgi:hypothetical protein
MCKLNCALFYYCCSLFIIVVHYFVRYSIFILCATFVSFNYLLFIHIHCLLLKKKRFNSDPGLYSRFSYPVVREVLHKNTITIYASQ